MDDRRTKQLTNFIDTDMLELYRTLIALDLIRRIERVLIISPLLPPTALQQNRLFPTESCLCLFLSKFEETLLHLTRLNTPRSCRPSLFSLVDDCRRR